MRTPSIGQFVRRPHPFIFGPLSLLVPGGATFLLIALLAPFGFKELAWEGRMLWAAGLGMVVAGCVGGVVKGLQWSVPGWMEPEKWTLGREIVLVGIVLLAIAVAVGLLLWMLGMGGESFGEWTLVILLRTLSIAFFPLTLLVLIEQFSHQRQRLREAKALSEQLESAALKEEEMPLVLRGENGKPALQVRADDLLFLQSAGNYVEVHHRDGSGQFHKDLVRNRLKLLLETLPPDRFFQCHKSYVVNVRHIRKVKGNARNYTLQLQFDGLEIPVARSRSAALSAFLNAPKSDA